LPVASGWTVVAVLGLLAAVAVLAPPAAQAREPARIGVVTDAMFPWHATTEGFRDGLKDLGYREGSTVVFEPRALGGDLSRVETTVADLVRQNLDLLFCVSDACPRVPPPLPLVFAQVGDPVKLGLVESIGQPRGNATGIATLRPELTAKRLDLFKELVPRFAGSWSPTTAAGPTRWRAWRSPARPRSASGSRCWSDPSERLWTSRVRSRTSGKGDKTGSSSCRPARTST
jgi:putative ABC transport system substrate-binding protein